LLLLLAAVLLVLAVQAVFWARQYQVTPDQLKEWWPDATEQNRLEMLKTEQAEHADSFNTWGRRARIAYNFGLLCLLAGLTVLAVPPASANPPARWAAVGVGAIALALELSWVIASFAPDPSTQPKPGTEAEQRYKADVVLAGRRKELLDAAREVESRFRQAQARRAPIAEMHRLGVEFDAALTEAMRAAYAARRTEIGPRGYEDRIYRRKAMAKPRVHVLTDEAEHLLTLRETHRLNGIPDVPPELKPGGVPLH
jgi:hypothetical protein